jgi:hypothetical protein
LYRDALSGWQMLANFLQTLPLVLKRSAKMEEKKNARFFFG